MDSDYRAPLGTCWLRRDYQGWRVVVNGRTVCGPTWTMTVIAQWARRRAVTLHNEEPPGL